MPRFLITTKSRTHFNGIRIEPGIAVFLLQGFMSLNRVLIKQDGCIGM